MSARVCARVSARMCMCPLPPVRPCLCNLQTGRLTHRLSWPPEGGWSGSRLDADSRGATARIHEAHGGIPFCGFNARNAPTRPGPRTCGCYASALPTTNSDDSTFLTASVASPSFAIFLADSSIWRMSSSCPWTDKPEGKYSFVGSLDVPPPLAAAKASATALGMPKPCRSADAAGAGAEGCPPPLNGSKSTKMLSAGASLGAPILGAMGDPSPNSIRSAIPPRVQ
mmetsp:Transcript_53740/g.151024  ORF Transcript_53740/g.151024 Transcript_53740/m.151024 type:complete len:226 (-) Transcript_53740:59-736(-)